MKVRFSIMAVVLIIFLIFINCGSDNTSGVDSDPPQSSSLSVEYTGSKNLGRAIHAIEPISLRNNTTGSNTASVNVTTTGKGCQVTANWTQCSSDDFASYSLYRSTNQFISSDTTSATRLTTVSTSSSTDYTDNTVANATTYFYVLKTTDESGLTSWSNEVDVTTPQSSDSPSPSDLSLAFTGDSKANTVSSAISTLFTTTASSRTALSSQTTEKGTCEVTATWTECPDGDFLSYTLYRSTSSGISQDTTSADNMGTFTSVSSTEYVDGAVDWETTYYYALITRDTQDLFAWSDEESITTPQGSESPSPSDLSLAFTGDSKANTISSAISTLFSTTASSRTALSSQNTGKSNCEVTATWTECPDGDFLSYTLYRSTSSGISQDTTGVDNMGTFTSVSSTEYVDGAVDWETTYYYALITRDTQDLFAWSDEESITTPSSQGGDITVTEPTASTVWEYGQTNTTVSWTGTTTTSVRIEIWQNGTKLDDFADWVPNTGSYTRAVALPASWGTGADYQIKVIDQDDSYGLSENFLLNGTIDVTTPSSSTLWTVGETNTQVEWTGGGAQVKLEVWYEGEYVSDYSGFITNTGSYTRSAPIPTTWSIGTHFRIRVVESGSTPDDGYSEEFQLTDEVDVTSPTSSTSWAWGETGVTVSWNEPYSDSVTIYVYKGGSSVATFAASVPNTGSYTRTDAVSSSWGWGDDFKIKVVGNLGSSGYSSEFSIWAMDISEPSSSTVWYWEQTNTEVHWVPGTGSNVRMEIWKDDSKVDDYCDWTPNDGSYARSSAIPEAWGEGDDYQIKMIDDLGNVGWSEEFSIYEWVPTDGLVASWLFTGGSLEDFSGTGNDAINHGAATTSDRFGNSNCAFDFDGSNDWMCIDCVVDDIDQSSFTESAWVKTPGSDYGMIIAFNTPSGNNRSYCGINSDGVLNVRFGDSHVYGTITFNDNEWHHILKTNDTVADEFNVYIDGQIDVTASMTGSYIHDTDLASIGQEWDSSPSDFFDGTIDDVRIYNRILNTADIQALYHEGGW